MVKRYVRFRAEGTDEDGRMITVEGLCDERRDPMEVAMARSVLLRQCQRVRLWTEPAFEVMCSGQRERRMTDISRQAREDQEKRAVQDRIAREVAEWMQQQKLRRMLGRQAIEHDEA